MAATGDVFLICFLCLVFHFRAMHLRGGDEHMVVGRHISMGRTSRAAFSKIADVLHGSYVTLIMN